MRVMMPPTLLYSIRNAMQKRMRFVLLATCIFTLAFANPALSASQRPKPLPVPSGADEAYEDFDKGIRILIGGEGVEPGYLDLGNGLMLEIATDACALGPDPAGYISDYNTAMKQRILEVYGVDVDMALLNAAP